MPTDWKKFKFRALKDMAGKIRFAAEEHAIRESEVPTWKMIDMLLSYIDRLENNLVDDVFET